jgi:rhodanese-related sulfurtransferase
MPTLDTPVIVYCSGPTCRRSPTVARLLEQMGYSQVSVYAGGKADWHEAGLPFETHAAPAARAVA